MLERVALHQTRFRTPGVTPDARGVVLGQRGIVLFPSLDRLVAFFRAYSEQGSLDELLASLEIRRVSTPLKTRELLLSVAAESSYRMDRIAGLAALAGGLTFTGTARHFVKYRDAGSPLGYDIGEVINEKADYVLYHDAFAQPYSTERTLSFRDLLFRLSPHKDPRAAKEVPGRVYVTAELGIGHALVSYLFRWEVRARAALAEWPSTSAFDDSPRRLFVFDIESAPPRILALFASLPGVTVFAPIVESAAIQLGYRHPIALESCRGIFEAKTLHLFRGDGRTEVLAPLPPFAPVRSLVRTRIDLAEGDARVLGEQVERELSLSLPLKLAPSNEPLRRVVAAVVPARQRAWLARILYVLPPSTLASLRMAFAEDVVYLLDAGGIEGVPLGRFYSEVAPRVYVPTGFSLVPAVSPTVLRDLVSEGGDGHVFFELGQNLPRVVPEDAFAPVPERALRAVGATTVMIEALSEIEPPLPLLEYEGARRFPLFGLPSLSAPQPEPEE